MYRKFVITNRNYVAQKKCINKTTKTIFMHIVIQLTSLSVKPKHNKQQTSTITETKSKISPEFCNHLIITA